MLLQDTSPATGLLSRGRSTMLTAQLHLMAHRAKLGVYKVTGSIKEGLKKLIYTCKYFRRGAGTALFHRKQLGVTATRQQEHQYAPKICAFWGRKYPVTYAVKNPKQTNQHHELQDREPTIVGLWKLQKPGCPLFFPRPGRPRNAKYSQTQGSFMFLSTWL